MQNIILKTKYKLIKSLIVLLLTRRKWTIESLIVNLFVFPIYCFPKILTLNDHGDS